MKKALLLIVCAVTFTMAEVHPGLKSAIDKGDYKSAANMVQKMNVQGMYLPSNLTIKDAELVYGKKLMNYKWLLNIDQQNCKKDERSDCSSEFANKYVEMLCSGSSEFYVNACLDWMNSTRIDDWKKIENSICKNKETIKTCSLYVREQPADVL